VRIGKTPKKLASICCSQRTETKADTLKQLRTIGEGDQKLEKKVSSRRINLEGNTHVQEINESQLPV
jgi:hypothetical protein